MDEEFQKLGLWYNKDCEYPSYHGFHAWEAVQAFFDLNEERADYLFCYDEYTTKNKTTPAQVIERIQQLMGEEICKLNA